MLAQQTIGVLVGAAGWAALWLVTHRELHTARRIRMVFDLLAEELQKSQD